MTDTPADAAARVLEQNTNSADAPNLHETMALLRRDAEWFLLRTHTRLPLEEIEVEAQVIEMAGRRALAVLDALAAREREVAEMRHQRDSRMEMLAGWDAKLGRAEAENATLRAQVAAAQEALRQVEKMAAGEDERAGAEHSGDHPCRTGFYFIGLRASEALRDAEVPRG